MKNRLINLRKDRIVDNNQGAIHLDLLRLDEKVVDKEVDFLKASTEELSEIIVSEMMMSVRKDLSAKIIK